MKKVTQNKKESIEHLKQLENKEIKQQLIFYNICLIAGSIIILFSLIYLFQNLGNNSVYWIGFLGLLSSIPFFVIYSLGIKSINEKNSTSSSPKKRKS